MSLWRRNLLQNVKPTRPTTTTQDNTNTQSWQLHLKLHSEDHHYLPSIIMSMFIWCAWASERGFWHILIYILIKTLYMVSNPKWIEKTVCSWACKIDRNNEQYHIVFASALHSHDVSYACSVNVLFTMKWNLIPHNASPHDIFTVYLIRFDTWLLFGKQNTPIQN